MLYPLFLILMFSFIPWIWIRIRNGVAALVALKCSGIAESINERNIFPWYVFFNVIHISVKAFVSRSEVGRRLQDGSVCSRPAFLHALQMIPKQAAGCSKHDHQHREGKNDRFLRDAARCVLLDRVLRLHALGFRELDNFTYLASSRFSCRSAGSSAAAPSAGEMGFGSSPVSVALGKGACFLSYALQQERAAQQATAKSNAVGITPRRTPA